MSENKPEIKGFYLHLSQCDALFNLPAESVVRALKMCCEYCRGNTAESEDPIANCAFGLMRPALDKSMKMAGNGRKGGEAKASNALANASKSVANSSKPLADSSKDLANEKQTEANASQRTKNKEQEIKNKEEREDTYSSASKDDALPAMILSAVITLPLNDGTEDVIVQPDIDEWQALYPAVDVLQELRNMRGWFLGNPTKHKTRRGIGRFIHSWLSKAQDKAGRPEQRRLSFQEEREQRELEKFLNDDRPLWGMTSSGGNNGQDPF